MGIKDRLNADTLDKLQDELLYGPEPDLPFARNLLMSCKLGIRSMDFLSALGYHSSDWSAMGTIQNQLNKKYDLGIRQLPLGKNRGKLLITQDNYDTYYTYVKRVRKAVKAQGIKEPQKLKDARAEGNKLRREEKTQEREKQKIDFVQRRLNRFNSLNLPKYFTTPQLAEALGTSRTYASKLVNELVNLGYVEKIFDGTGLGKKSEYMRLN